MCLSPLLKCKLHKGDLSDLVITESLLPSTGLETQTILNAYGLNLIPHVSVKGLLFQEACPDPAPAALVTAYLSICSLDSGQLEGRASMFSFSASHVPTRACHIAGTSEFCQITGPPDATPPCDGSHRSENWVIFSPVPRFNLPSCTPRIGRTLSVTPANEEVPTEFSILLVTLPERELPMEGYSPRAHGNPGAGPARQLPLRTLEVSSGLCLYNKLPQESLIHTSLEISLRGHQFSNSGENINKREGDTICPPERGDIWATPGVGAGSVSVKEKVNVIRCLIGHRPELVHLPM